MNTIDKTNETTGQDAAISTQNMASGATEPLIAAGTARVEQGTIEKEEGNEVEEGTTTVSEKVSAMAGADLSRDYSTSTEKETEWGIDISEPWGPPSPGEDAGPKSIKHYVFRIYFLPVPTQPSILSANHWTQELFDFLPPDNALTPQIDKNSACWKI